jgi:ElaB/YqjD/DUF883 family membrane-anchored ribosome-binding protein
MSNFTADNPDQRVKDQLVNDLRAVIQDAQQLLDNRLSSCESQASQVRQRLSQWQHASDEYVHQHPWATVGVAVGMGVAMGWLMGRR